MTDGHSVASQPAGERQLEFVAGGEKFAIPAGHVREILCRSRITTVPHAPDSLLGLGNFRGSICPVLSFGRLIDLPVGSEERLILLDKPVPLAIAVDAVSGLVSDRTVADDDATSSTVDIAVLLTRDYGGDVRRGQSGTPVAAMDARAVAGEDDTLPLLLFSVAGQSFALPVAAIDEVAYPSGSVTTMPDADAAVLGTIVLRDHLLPLLSLAALLGLDGDTGDGIHADRIAGGRGAPAIVMRIGSHRIGLVADRVVGMIRVADRDIDPVPMVLARGGAEARIHAICRLENGRRLASILSPDHLVREDLTSRLLQGSGRADTKTDLVAAVALERFLHFRIGDQSFGLPIAAVVEVARLPERVTRLPGPPPFVKGVMNLRGEAIPVIDQVLRFRNRAAERTDRRVIIVRIGRLLAGFLVETVIGVIQVAADTVREAPDLGNAGMTEEVSDGAIGGRLFTGVVPLDDNDQLMLILCPRTLLGRAERDLYSSVGDAKAAALS